jgi:hypothetical protein
MIGWATSSVVRISFAQPLAGAVVANSTAVFDE